MPHNKNGSLDITSSCDTEQALSAAVQLLADIESQICKSLGLAPDDSLPTDAEQLREVPLELLNSLEEAVLLVHELRQQVVTQQSQQASSSKPAGATAGSASPTPSSPPCRAKPRSTANSPSQRTRSPQQGAKGAAVTSSIAAARSSLFTRAATDRAVAEWHQSKLQQQADAALAQQQQCAREEQLLDQLTAMEEAAVPQHEQDLQHTSQLQNSVALLRLLMGSKQRWREYLAAHQTLDMA